MKNVQVFLFLFALLCFLVSVAVTPPSDLPSRWTRVGLAVLTLTVGWTVLR